MGEIERRRRAGESFRALAAEYGLAEVSIRRHMTNHVEHHKAIVELVNEAVRADPSIAVMTIEEQRQMILGICQKMVERMRRLVDELTDADVVLTSFEGSPSINPKLPELRSWIDTWVKRIEHIDKMRVASAVVKIEADKVALMERAFDAALDAAGITDPSLRAKAYLAMAEVVR